MLHKISFRMCGRLSAPSCVDIVNNDNGKILTVVRYETLYIQSSDYCSVFEL